MGGMTKILRVGAPAGTIRLFAAVIVAAAALIVGGQASAGETGAPAWRVGEIQGEARISTRAGSWRRLGQGDAIGPNSEVETGAAGRLRLAGRRGSIIVLPNSRFGLRALPGKQAKMQEIVQRTGSLQFDIAATPATPLRIKTPFLTAAIADATFTITVNRANAALYVEKGAARVMSVLTGEAAVLQPRQLAWVNAPSGGRLKTIMMRPRTASPANPAPESPARTPRTGERVLAQAALSQPAG
ncbi:MAG: FecR domain-containing protein [Alphaproteobacteria bacterium]